MRASFIVVAVFGSGLWVFEVVPSPPLRIEEKVKLGSCAVAVVKWCSPREPFAVPFTVAISMLCWSMWGGNSACCVAVMVGC